jgi:integrase
VASLYKRKGSKRWWVSFYDAQGKRRFHPTHTEDEKAADAIRLIVEKKMAAEKLAAREADESGPMTVAKFGRLWLKRRKHLSSASDDEGRFKKWVEPNPLAARLLTEVRPGDVKAFVQWLEKQPSTKGGLLASRTVLHVYALLRVMFADAVADELVTATPCVLKARRKELPRKRDKDPLWRATAVYSRHEVEALISDDRLPEDRRVLWAILFLSGMRAGEASDRRWRDYDADAKPLGRLTVSSSFDSRRKVSKETKTGVPRQVPVHPALAALLASWKLGGWAAMLGRPPAPGDLIMPSRWGENRRVNGTPCEALPPATAPRSACARGGSTTSGGRSSAWRVRTAPPARFWSG